MEESLVLNITLGLLLALISAISGYAFQNYRRRARPFVILRGFSGTTTLGSHVVRIEDAIVAKLETSHYIHKLTNDSALSEVEKAINEAEEVIDSGAKVRDLLQMAIQLLQKAQSDADVLSASSRPITLHFFDKEIVPFSVDFGQRVPRC